MKSSNEPDKNVVKKLSPIGRYERLVFVVALVGLSATGLPQRYALNSWADFVITMLGGIESARILHRFFAVLLMGVALYHAFSVVYRWVVLKQRLSLLPRWADWKDLFTSVLSNFGLRDAGRVNNQLPLKVEYLFLLISSLILIITGGILLNPILVTDSLPGTTIPIALSIHSDQALLISVFLIVWRMAIMLFWRPKRIATDAQNTTHVSSGSRVFLAAASIVFIALIAIILRLATHDTMAIDTVARIDEALVFSPQFVPEVGDPEVGELVWSTQRCAFCHGEQATGGVNGEPALPTEGLTLNAFVTKIRTGGDEMPAFSKGELPDGYLVHLWAWLSERN